MAQAETQAWDGPDSGSPFHAAISRVMDVAMKVTEQADDATDAETEHVVLALFLRIERLEDGSMQVSQVNDCTHDIPTRMLVTTLLDAATSLAEDDGQQVRLMLMPKGNYARG